MATNVGGNPEILAPNELVNRRQNAFCDSVLEALMRNCEASAPFSMDVGNQHPR